MHVFRQRLFSHLRFRGPAYLVLVVALVPTFVAYWRAEKNAHDRDEARFESMIHDSENVIRENLEHYVADLRAFSSLFEANTIVNRREWNTFIDSLEFGFRHP